MLLTKIEKIVKPVVKTQGQTDERTDGYTHKQPASRRDQWIFFVAGQYTSAMWLAGDKSNNANGKN